MTAGGADVEAALRTVLDPHASSDQAKHKAQRDLEAFKSSETGLHWAINVLDSAVSTSATEPALWLAADTALFWARYRAAAGSQALLTLRHRLWAWLQCGAGGGPALPHFVLSKLAAALACLACLTWPAAYPEFWPQLQHCLAEQPDMGLRLLAALLEEFQSLAQATSSGYRGRVRAAAAAAMPLPVGYHALHSIFCEFRFRLGLLWPWLVCRGFCLCPFPPATCLLLHAINTLSPAPTQPILPTRQSAA
jgi:hypothetical protein